MQTLEIAPILYPNRVYRLDQFAVPLDARGNFEAAMRRNLAYLSTLHGFQGHVVLTKVGGPTRFHYATLAAWEDAAAFERAKEAMQAYMAQIGFDAAAQLAEWRVEAELGAYTATAGLQ